jgi:hypothetical protein
MAMAFVQGTSVSGAAGTTPQALPALASAVAVGDLIVVLAGGDGGATGLATSVTDSLGNTYTRVPSFDIANSGGTLNLDAFYARVTVAGSSNVITLAFNSASENCVVVAQHFNGFTGTVTLDKSARSSNVSSTTVTSGATAATTQAAELVVGLAIHASTVSAYTLGSGYTNLTQVSIANRQAAMESKVVAATGAQTATFTIAAARVNIGGVLTFYDAAGATTTTTTTAATTTTTTTAAPKPKTATLLDNMDDNSLGAEWTPTGASGASGANSGGIYTMSLPASATATAYTSLQSTGLYDLTASYIYAKVLSVPLATQTSTDATLMFYVDANNWIRWVYEGGVMYAQYKKAGVQTTAGSVSYNATNAAFWQIIESGGTINWQTSPDGVTWTTIASATHGMTLTSGQIMFEAYCYAAQTNPGTFQP